MKDKYYQLIKEKYRNKGKDFTELFQTLLSTADETGLNRALKYLEECIIEKRLSWLDKNLGKMKKRGNPIDDSFKIFYEIYLGLSIPKDGEVVEKTDRKLVTRWWNPCPVLEVCKKLGLDTRGICKKAYHRPVQIFFSRINPKLKFDRNYDCLRPHMPHCEEIITLED